MDYFNEFVTIAFVHLLAVASPGPDFAIVVKNSLVYGRRVALMTSVGIGTAILLHVGYSLVGLSVLIATTDWLYTFFMYCAVAYLAYLGITALFSRPAKALSIDDTNKTSVISMKKAFSMGFLTNGLNPKATLFFLSLFTVVIDADTPNTVKGIYGIYLAIATGAWFCMLSYLLSSAKIANAIGSKGYWLDRIMGLFLLGLAIKLVLS